MQRGGEVQSVEQHELDDEQEVSGGSWFSRTINKLRGVPEEDEYEEPLPSQGGRGSAGARTYNTVVGGGNGGGPRQASAPASSSSKQTFRIASARESQITVMPVTNFADIQRAADRLKTGEAQIINLEKTPAEVSERLIDFLNGVTYALDGYVEKIAEGAYLFTPSHILIHVEGAEPPQPRPFFDR